MKKRKMLMEIEDIIEIPYSYLDKEGSLRKINDLISKGYRFVNLTYSDLNRYAVLIKYK